MTAIDDKIKAFTPFECVEKAIEEANEYAAALNEFHYALMIGDEHAGQKALEVFREAADVHVTGFATLSHIWPAESQEYWNKIDEAIGVSIPAAVQAKRSESDAMTAKIRANMDAGRFPCEGLLGDDDGDA